MRTFRTKVDLSILAFTLFFLLIPVAFALYFGQWIVMAVLLLFAGGVVYSIVSIRYTITGSRLINRSFLSKTQVIAIADIAEVRPSRDIISAPAASFDRLLIRYNKKTVLISPVRKDEFIGQLLLINPEIKVKQ